MILKDIIAYLRNSVNVQMTGAEDNDPNYLEMTDEDIELILSIVMTRDFPEVYSLENLPNENVYPVVVLSKIELYYTLAVKNANMIDLVADNNNQLKRNQRFTNYMNLIAQAKNEYDRYIETGGAGRTLTSFNVYLPNRYNTRYNRERGIIPALIVCIDSVQFTSLNLHWDIKAISRFGKSEVYISKTPVFDIHEERGSKILENAIKVKTTHDFNDVVCKINGLEPSTEYYVGVACYDLSEHVAYSQCKFKTETPPIVENPLPNEQMSRRSTLSTSEEETPTNEVPIENEDIKIAFREGIHEVFQEMFTNQVYYCPIDLEATGDIGVYRESVDVKYKEPVRFDACKLTMTPTVDASIEVSNFDYDASFTIPMKDMLDVGIDVNKKNWSTITQGIFIYKEDIFEISRMSTGTNVADEYLFFIFYCRDKKKRSI